MNIEDVIKTVLETVRNDLVSTYEGVFEVTENSSCCDGTRTFLVGEMKLGPGLVPSLHEILTFFLPSNFEDMERPPVEYVIGALCYKEQLVHHLSVATQTHNVVWIPQEQ